MAKKNKPAAPSSAASQDKPATLKDLLNPDVVNKLKAQADQMKAEAEIQREEARKQAEAARKAEQKRLDNDFEYLLNNSGTDWKKYK
ncbi:YqkE family protein [Paenibacillus sp. MZ04-78.2]|uniref:YqkE family protein n=1 Tax=Paenibacillus sp. MZ04-78.2 TaxID=2962034 RepID=UPI0020B8FB63|nr:YqkE family protein [Paenibacillus sp. MZ04-78.2]MCP3773125.1 YqkE family protein [Paenibacillus sp. MZ04-78.2]